VRVRVRVCVCVYGGGGVGGCGWGGGGGRVHGCGAHPLDDHHGQRLEASITMSRP